MVYALAPRTAMVAGAFLVATLVSACDAATSSTAAPGSASISPTAATAVSPSPTAAASAQPMDSAPAASASAPADVLDTSTIGTHFPFSLRVPVPEGWITLLPPQDTATRTVGMIHGDRAGDTATWWGPSIMLVDGASVRDPSVTTGSEPAAKVPWPASYIDYLTALPGVKVEGGPEPITIDGVHGRAVTVSTPPMPPTIWLKNDSTWIGGGPTGTDPEFTRYVVELEAGDQPIVLEYDDDPAKFESRMPEVEALLSSIRFGG